MLFFNFKLGSFKNIRKKMHDTHAAVSKVENSAQVYSYNLKFAKEH